MFVTLIIFVAVLFVLVMVHEAGHFFASRRFGVKVDEFGFGIPPRIFGWRKRDDGKREIVLGAKAIDEQKRTLFSLNWLPIGGFVKIKGQDEETPGADSFSSQKAWKRSLILGSGVLANIILAFVIFVFLFSIGSESYIPDGVSLKGANVSRESIKIVAVSNHSPAEEGGIVGGDTIVSIDSLRFETVAQIRSYIQQHANQELALTVSRGNEALVKRVTPREMEGSDGKALIGIQMVRAAVVRYPIHLAIVKGAEATGVSLYQIVKGIGAIITRLFQGEKVSGDVAGPIGIAVMTGQAARLGFLYILQFIAVLSLNLAFINIIPFPALDGGRILFILIEKFRKKQMSAAIEQWTNMIGFSLLLLLIAFVTVKDLGKLESVQWIVNGIKNIF